MVPLWDLSPQTRTHVESLAPTNLVLPLLDVDLIIIGSGPAGISTALHLVRQDPAWAGRMLVLDKAVHPREKLCGGGITRPGLEQLAGLGLALEPAHVVVDEVWLQYGKRAYGVREKGVFFIVRRSEFDHWLVQQAQQRGVEIRQGEAVTAVDLHPGHVLVSTDQASYRAKAVVAADGSNSTVRRLLKWKGNGKARLLETLTAESGQENAFQQGIVHFDFRPLADGLQGYYWDFPSLVVGQPSMNRGIFDSRARPELPRASLKTLLAQSMALRERTLSDTKLKGFPIHHFDPTSDFTRPRLLLAGDAAGADPLLGEGISFALAYGEVAASTIVDAFERHDFQFADYRSRILGHPWLGTLVSRYRGARWLYRLARYPRLAGSGDWSRHSSAHTAASAQMCCRQQSGDW